MPAMTNLKGRLLITIPLTKVKPALKFTGNVTQEFSMIEVIGSDKGSKVRIKNILFYSSKKDAKALAKINSLSFNEKQVFQGQACFLNQLSEANLNRSNCEIEMDGNNGLSIHVELEEALAGYIPYEIYMLVYIEASSYKEENPPSNPT